MRLILRDSVLLAVHRSLTATRITSTRTNLDHTRRPEIIYVKGQRSRIPLLNTNHWTLYAEICKAAPRAIYERTRAATVY